MQEAAMRPRSHRRNLVVMPLARGGRARWWLLLAGGMLTAAGFMLRGATSGMVFLPGLVCLAFAPLVPARPAHDHRFPVTGRY
jgi:hypothetical protein